MSLIKKFFNSKPKEAEQDSTAMKAAAGEGPEVSGRSAKHQEMHVVRELPGDGGSLRNNQEQDVEYTEGHPLVAMEPAVISSAGEEGPEASDRSANQQEIDAARKLPATVEGMMYYFDQYIEEFMEKYPLVRSTDQTISTLRSQFRAALIVAPEPAVISSAAEEEPEVSGRSVNYQETDVVGKLSTDDDSSWEDIDDTEEHPLITDINQAISLLAQYIAGKTVAMEPAVISSAGEEGPEVSDRPANHQETHAKVMSMRRAVSLIQSQYRAGVIDPENAIKKLEDIYRINIYSYWTVSFSLCLLVTDVVSDISVGIRYFIEEEWVYGWFTLGVVIAASLIQQAIDWKYSLWKKHRGKKWFWLWIGPYMAFNIESVHMYVRNLKRVRQFRTYKEQKSNAGIHKLMRCWNDFIYEYCEVAKTKHWEAMLEAGPQMVLQIYILLKTFTSLSFDLTSVLQLLALGTSLLGLTATQFTLYKALRLKDAQRISTCPVVLRAIGISFPIGCRAVSIATLMSVRPVWGGLMLGCHWLAATRWVWYTYRDGVVEAAAAGLRFILGTFETTPLTAVICNALWFIEDIAMLVLWWTLTDFPAALALLCGTLAVELVFRIVLCILKFNKDKLYEEIQF